MEVVSYHNWSEFMYIDSWGFVVLDFKKTNWRHCIAELTFIFGECNTASDNIWTIPRVQQQHGLPVHRFYHAAFAPKRRLAHADFYRMQIVAKKKKTESGAKREGQSGFRKQDINFTTPLFWGHEKNLLLWRTCLNFAYCLGG